MIRIETTDEQVLQHVSPKISEWDQIGIAPLTPDPARPIVES
jgi:hypothetical protein